MKNGTEYLALDGLTPLEAYVSVNRNIAPADIIYMTYRPDDAIESATGRRQIEITPSMLKAAAGELAGFNREFATIEEGAQRILEAAMAARET